MTVSSVNEPFVSESENPAVQEQITSDPMINVAEANTDPTTQNVNIPASIAAVHSPTLCETVNSSTSGAQISSVPTANVPMVNVAAANTDPTTQNVNVPACIATVHIPTLCETVHSSTSGAQISTARVAMVNVAEANTDPTTQNVNIPASIATVHTPTLCETVHSSTSGSQISTARVAMVNVAAANTDPTTQIVKVPASIAAVHTPLLCETVQPSTSGAQISTANVPMVNVAAANVYREPTTQNVNVPARIAAVHTPTLCETVHSSTIGAQISTASDPMVNVAAANTAPTTQNVNIPASIAALRTPTLCETVHPSSGAQISTANVPMVNVAAANVYREPTTQNINFPASSAAVHTPTLCETVQPSTSGAQISTANVPMVNIAAANVYREPTTQNINFPASSAAVHTPTLCETVHSSTGGAQISTANVPMVNVAAANVYREPTTQNINFPASSAAVHTPTLCETVQPSTSGAQISTANVPMVNVAAANVYREPTTQNINFPASSAAVHTTTLCETVHSSTGGAQISTANVPMVNVAAANVYREPTTQNINFPASSAAVQTPTLCETVHSSTGGAQISTVSVPMVNDAAANVYTDIDFLDEDYGQNSNFPDRFTSPTFSAQRIPLSTIQYEHLQNYIEISSSDEIKTVPKGNMVRINRNVVRDVQKNSSSVGNFGWGLAKQIFKTEEMLNCNYRGVQGKNALSPRRKRAIEEAVGETYGATETNFIQVRKSIDSGIRDKRKKQPVRSSNVTGPFLLPQGMDYKILLQGLQMAQAQSNVPV